MSGLPLYLSLQKDIVGAISRGDYAPGDLLPTEQQFCAQYGISRATVRKALDNLCADGRVVRRHGIGTFVRAAQSPDQRARFKGYLDDVLVHDPENRFLRVSSKRGRFAPEIIKLFGDATVEKGSVSLSVLHRQGRPIMIGEIYLPEPLAEQDTPSAYETSEQPTLVILRRAGIRLGRGQQRLHAVTAGREAARLLDLPERTPVLGVERVYFDMHDRAVALIKGMYHPANYEIGIDLQPRTEGRFLQPKEVMFHDGR